MNIEPVSFLIGIVTTIIISGILAIKVAYMRHRCKFCKGHTKKICRLFALQDSQHNNAGTKLFALYIFRSCRNDHVTVSVKTVSLTGYEITRKPKDEFDWHSPKIHDLCQRSTIKNPIIEPVREILMTHPTLHSRRW